MYCQHAHPEFYMYLTNDQIIIFHFSSQIPVVQRCMINCIRKLPIFFFASNQEEVSMKV